MIAFLCVLCFIFGLIVFDVAAVSIRDTLEGKKNSAPYAVLSLFLWPTVVIGAVVFLIFFFKTGLLALNIGYAVAFIRIMYSSSAQKKTETHKPDVYEVIQRTSAIASATEVLDNALKTWKSKSNSEPEPITEPLLEPTPEPEPPTVSEDDIAMLEALNKSIDDLKKTFSFNVNSVCELAETDIMSSYYTKQITAAQKDEMLNALSASRQVIESFPDLLINLESHRLELQNKVDKLT